MNTKLGSMASRFQAFQKQVAEYQAQGVARTTIHKQINFNPDSFFPMVPSYEAQQATGQKEPHWNSALLQDVTHQYQLGFSHRDSSVPSKILDEKIIGNGPRENIIDQTSFFSEVTRNTTEVITSLQSIEVPSPKQLEVSPPNTLVRFITKFYKGWILYQIGKMVQSKNITLEQDSFVTCLGEYRTVPGYFGITKFSTPIDVMFLSLLSVCAGQIEIPGANTHTPEKNLPEIFLEALFAAINNARATNQDVSTPIEYDKNLLKAKQTEDHSTIIEYKTKETHQFQKIGDRREYVTIPVLSIRFFMGASHRDTRVEIEVADKLESEFIHSPILRALWKNIHSQAMTEIEK